MKRRRTTSTHSQPPPQQPPSSSSNKKNEEKEDTTSSSPSIEIELMTDVLLNKKRMLFSQASAQQTNDKPSFAEPMEYVSPANKTKNQAHNHKSVYHQYCGRLKVSTSTGYEHVIGLGDIIAFESKQYGGKERPLAVPWTVGQVVTLFAAKESVSVTRYYATVQWLPSWKKRISKVLSHSERQAHNKNFRPDQALVESQTLLTLDIAQHVLPLQVCLDSWQVFQHKNAVPPELIRDDDEDLYRVFCNCVLRQVHHNAQVVVEDVRDDWTAYVAAASHTQPPVVLQRAWALLQDDELQGALRHYFETCMAPPDSPHPFARFQTQWILPSTSVPLLEEHVDDEQEEEEQQQREQQQQTRKTRKETTTKKKSKKRKQTKQAEPDEDESTAIHNNRRISFELPTPKGNKRRKKQTNDDENAVNHTRPHKPIDVTLPVFVPDDDKAAWTVPVKKQQQGKPCEFYYSVSCSPAPLHHYHTKFWNKTATADTSSLSSWTIHIGDVIAVRLDNPQALQLKSSLAKSENMPFRVKWGVAQVLSFYSTTHTDHVEMEIRWFSTIDELRDEVQERAPARVKNGSCLVEMDEVVGKVPVNLALGPIRVTSTIVQKKPPPIQPLSDSCPMPLWYVSCLDLCETATDSIDLYALDHDDWPSVDSLQVVSDAPYRRGLFCPKALPFGQIALRKKYEMHMRKRIQQLNGLQEPLPKLGKWFTRLDGMNNVLSVWSLAQLNPTTSVVQNKRENLLCSSKGTNYYRGLELIALKQRCDPRAISKLSTTTFSVELGDVVCLADNEAVMPKQDTTNKKTYRHSNVNFPFSGPWTIYQILAIREVEDRRTNRKSFSFEGRRLFRPDECDFPSNWRENVLPVLIKDEKSFSIPVLYESDLVEDNLPVSRILGLVDLKLGPNDAPATDLASPNLKKSSAEPQSFLTVENICQYFYYVSLARLQPLFVSSLDPLKWRKRFKERGIAFSDYIRNDTTLSNLVESELGIDIRKMIQTDNVLSGNGLGQLFTDFAQEETCHTAKRELLFSKERSEGPATFFLSARIDPPWDKYQREVCHPMDRKNNLWKVRVGDTVAVRDKTTDKSLTQDALFPFTEKWYAAQVLAIFEGDLPDEALRVEVRSFVVEENPTCPGIPKLFENERDDKHSIATLPMSELLGPITVASPAKINRVWNFMTRFLPACPFVYGGVYDRELSGSGVFPNRWAMMEYIVNNGINQSLEYSKKERDILQSKLLPILREELEDDSDELTPRKNKNARHKHATPMSKVSQSSSKSSSSCTTTQACGPAFHIDASDTEYFGSLHVLPPHESYNDEITKMHPPPSGAVNWKISLGDVVALRYKHCFGKVVYGPMAFAIDKSKSFPFKENWAVAEVVNIFRPSANSAYNSPSDFRSTMKLEVRWLYRLPELKSLSAEQKMVSDPRLCEEILESDHYDVVSTSSILAPVCITESPIDATTRWRTHLGMPVLEFFCRRFWSARRKALVPFGSLSRRITRGRLKSPIIEKDVQLAAKLAAMEEHVAPKPDSPTSSQVLATKSNLTWRDHYANAIRKLSLSDASKEGYEGNFYLVGREKERKKINSFLNGAVLGMARESASSIFIAGPPGTGKTASVLAAVKEMKRKKAAPDFDFVYLNGMEMRHPFEAYVQLWEKISGKSQCAPDVAAAKLEAYFTRDDPNQESQVTIVLLDEIDYLVTKTQSVLYNFFDWPMRACQRKLVLLGISNTLNLPEHMHQRVQSRIGSRRCIFKAYDADQIKEILKSKLSQASPDWKVFEQDALIFASKKTASQSGDLRKAFHICRAAADYVLNEHKETVHDETPPVVRIKDVLKVSRESFHSAQSKAATMCAPFEALLLVALAMLYKTSGRELGGFDVEEIVTKMEGVANSYGDEMYLPPPSLGETLEIIRRLCEAHLVSVKSPKTSSVSFRASVAGSGGPWPLVSLLVEDCAVFQALKSTRHKDLAQKHLGLANIHAM